jgi:hypothetical protein
MGKQEVSAMTKIVNSMINNGLADELVVACLMSSMDSCFSHLKTATESSGILKPHQIDDIQDSVDCIRAAIVVLRHYTTDTYEEEAKMVNSLTITPEDYF